MIEPLIEGDLAEIESYLRFAHENIFAGACSPGMFTIKLDHLEQAEKVTPDVYAIWDCPEIVCFHDEHHAAVQEAEFEAVERK